MSSNSSFEDSDKENSTPNTVRTIHGVQRLQKRVVFSPLPALLQPSLESRPDRLKLPQRSVLKPFNSSSSPLSSPTTEKPDSSRFAYMIESAIRSLGGRDRASKIDTYATLSNLFRSFEVIPERAQLLGRIGELFECILADIVRPSEENAATPDFPLNTKALKVAGFLLFETEIAAAIPVRLARSLLEHSLVKMEADKPTKATSTQFLWLWQTQHLPKAVMTAEISERILLASVKVDFPSLIINQERMSVFLRLLDQSRECMVRNVDLWLPRVINYLLDDNKQIRTAALRTALEAGRLLCRVPSVGRSVQNHLKSSVAGRPYIQVTSDRFKVIMQEADGGIHVAHAWGAICTLSSSQNPERSKTLMDWMHVLQVVFNSPATENKVMAQSAWVRMIHYFGNNGDIIYRDKNLAYLTKPMARMLSPEVRVYDTVRMAAVNTICSLLYTLIRPSMSAAQMTTVWHELIVPVFSSMLEKHQKDSLQQRAVDILTAIFEAKTLVPWTLDRLLDSTVGTEDEIAQLDPRWVKANIAKIAPIMISALQSSATQESRLFLWTSLQKCLRAASAKEIQISSETMEATAAVCHMVQTIWQAPLPSLGSPSSRLGEDISLRAPFVASLVLSTFDHFGTSSFTEKPLSSLTTTDERAPLPDSPATQGTALKFIFKLFLEPISEAVVGSDYIDLLERVVSRAISGQKSLRKSLSLLSQCLSCLPMEATQLPMQSWKVLADVAASQIRTDTEKMSISSPAYPTAADGDEKWVATREILICGLRMQPHRPANEEWLKLADAYLRAIEKQLGTSAIDDHVIEPITEALSSVDTAHLLEYLQFLLQASISSTRHSKMSTLNLSRTDTQIRTPLFPQILCSSLTHEASAWQKYKLSEPLLGFLDSTANYLTSTKSQQISSIFQTLHTGLNRWISRAADGAQPLALATLDAISRWPEIQASHLELCNATFIAAFETADEAVLHQTIDTWNTTFGQKSRLEYPEALVKAINEAQLPVGSLLLPTWPEQDPEVLQGSSHSGPSPVASEQAIAPPKMGALVSSKASGKEKRRSRSRGSSQISTRSRRASKVPEVQIKQESPSAERQTRKRKRRGTLMPDDIVVLEDSPSMMEVAVPLNDVDSEAEVEDAKAAHEHKRRKGPQRINHKTPAVKSTRRSMTTRQSSMTATSEDDVFTSPGAGGTFTLRKRELRNLSPDIPSDPISESSPSVHTRMRKLSASQEPPIMAPLRLTPRPFSPIILQDPDEGERGEGETAEVDEIASPLHSARDAGVGVGVVVNSDDLMQLQIQGEEADDQRMEELDEDLFILQLEQYRSSLKQGRPITPRRRERLGVLMKEITRLSGDVAEAYFS